jgi:hypothetical protein
VPAGDELASFLATLQDGYRRKAATLSTHGDFIRGMAQA